MDLTTSRKRRYDIESLIGVCSHGDEEEHDVTSRDRLSESNGCEYCFLFKT